MVEPRIGVGIVGARGHAGAELVRLLAAHPRFGLVFVSSRELAGQRVAEHLTDPGLAAPLGELRYSAPTHEQLPGLGAEAVVLALPNGKAAACVAAFDAAGADPAASNPVLVDLSADYRFDEAWYYGLPELTRGDYRGQRRIANPGCYATAMQLAIAPMRDALDGAVQCFGVSGYSGAGTTPSDRNDPDKLRDNLMPYALTGHVHEREVSRRLGHPVEFMPHVAPHFRGITITANLHLSRPFTLDEVQARYRDRYAGEPLVHVVDEAPWVSRIAGRHHDEIGGFALSADGRRLVVVATEDNLLKGAATQALQNLNLAFGLPEFAGIPVPRAQERRPPR
ncbi:N-acetyl-gamma-glutamyl-phosphate reductase [Cognatiluteimonas weifangensis]|uniref:N-acetyl-gamma-glutamyl-phosphate reductase n=1 Tax=Cognatiluteimonas weifangensis TaxID=2303539 RepID=A0A372DN20_9GAMM|nr:N-acetyl-gamma-glutamyl-phosphate reductase [Luteimonas weifangensis]RFP60807.1 N-acetyl-gamma-glutamyl-phosphate reductase [Luteimonas weifangensis]